MNGYTKLFSSIITSSLWVQETPPTKVVWVTLLALSDQDGVVEGSIPGLAHLAGVTVEDCEKALARFQAPDPYSRTPDNEGRRIEVIAGGWKILNRAKYREKDWKQDRLERHREANRRYYERLKAEEGTNSDNPKSESDSLGDKKEKEEQSINLKTSLSEVPSDGEGESDSPVPLKAKPKQASPEAERLTALFQREILRNKPDYKFTAQKLQKWAATADLMLRRDGRTKERIARLIQWVQQEPFWMSNVLSMEKLREKFDELELKMQRNGKAQPTSFANMDYTAGLERRADGSFAL